jgi:hypothetical protein
MSFYNSAQSEGHDSNRVLQLLYYYDRVFSHGSQATVNQVFEVFRHGSHSVKTVSQVTVKIMVF